LWGRRAPKWEKGELTTEAQRAPSKTLTTKDTKGSTKEKS